MPVDSCHNTAASKYMSPIRKLVSRMKPKKTAIGSQKKVSMYVKNGLNGLEKAVDMNLPKYLSINTLMRAQPSHQKRQKRCLLRMGPTVSMFSRRSAP